MLLSPAVARAGDGTFPDATSSTVGAGDGPQDVAVGDFNNDGRDDLAVVNSSSHNVTVRLGAGDGTFNTEAVGSPFGALVGGDLPQAVALGDFNGDGNEDLAIPDWNVRKVTVLLGAGTGAFTGGVQYDTGVGCITPSDVAIGDFNGDGNDDLAVTCLSGVMVRLGAADGSFNSVVAGSPFAAGSLPSALAVGDFNNDGKADLAITNQGSGNVTVRLGAGDGTFAATPTGSPFAIGPSPKSIAVGDFNADGFEDIAVGNYNDPGMVSVRLGLGDGTFNGVPLGSPYPTTAMPWGVGVGDFNSDGIEDLAVTSQGGAPNFIGSISVRLGAGDGGFPSEAAGSPLSTGSTSRGIAIGDFNGDGNEDLVAANSGDDNVAIRLGDGPAPLAGNLLTNGGFEGAGALREPTLDPPPEITGWTRTGTMTAARYGMRFSSIFPSHLDSPRFTTGGMNYLFGGPSGAASTASQSVDVSSSAPSIDGGVATARLSAYLGGGNLFEDNMRATGAFLDGSGAELGSFTIGPVTAADRRNVSTLLPRAASSPVPAGTRTIQVTLTATNADAAGNSAFADNVKLTLDAPEPPPPVVTPPPPAADDKTPPETIKGRKGPKRRSARRSAKFRFTSSEPGSTFQCKLDKRPFAPCTSPRKVKHLKRGKHRFKAVATDAAGNVDPTPAKWRFRVVKRRR